jgi:hypothetical protein
MVRGVLAELNTVFMPNLDVLRSLTCGLKSVLFLKSAAVSELCLIKFRVCKFMLHHTFNWINQTDAATSQVYYSSFKYSQHDSSIVMPIIRSYNSYCCWSWSGRLARPRTTALLSPSSDGKQETATAVVVAPDDGHDDTRIMLAVFKRRVINLRSCCILLVDSIEKCLISLFKGQKYLFSWRCACVRCKSTKKTLRLELFCFATFSSSATSNSNSLYTQSAKRLTARMRPI